ALACRADPLLAHADRLTLAATQVIELCATDLRMFDDLDLLDRRCVQREDAFDALSKGDLSHRHRGPRPGAAKTDDQSFENLNALADLFLHAFTLHTDGLVLLDGRFLDLHVDADGVSGTQLGKSVLGARCFDLFYLVHIRVPFCEKLINSRETGVRSRSRAAGPDPPDQGPPTPKAPDAVRRSHGAPLCAASAPLAR